MEEKKVGQRIFQKNNHQGKRRDFFEGERKNTGANVPSNHFGPNTKEEDNILR